MTTQGYRNDKCYKNTVSGVQKYVKTTSPPKLLKSSIPKIENLSELDLKSRDSKDQPRTRSWIRSKRNQNRDLSGLYYNRPFRLTFMAISLLAYTMQLPLLIRAAPFRIPDSCIHYLRQFNYLPKNESTFSEKMIDLRDGLIRFQRFANIPVTGIYDSDTQNAMKIPRCGVVDIPDNIGPEEFYEESSSDEQSTYNVYGDKNENKILSNQYLAHHSHDIQEYNSHDVSNTNGYREPFGQIRKKKKRRAKRYVLQGTKWSSTNLTYKIIHYTNDLHRSVTDEIIENSFKVWTIHANLNITKINRGNPDIVVSFERLSHGDGEPFDGPGQVLAHAFFPQFGGDAHFDDDEKWSSSSYSGANLFQVASHEFGHSLGLSHSSNREALMAPFYKTFQGNVKLHRDDIQGIQRLYGKPTGSPIDPNNRFDDGPKPPKVPYTPQKIRPTLTSHKDHHQTPSFWNLFINLVKNMGPDSSPGRSNSDEPDYSDNTNPQLPTVKYDHKKTLAPGYGVNEHKDGIDLTTDTSLKPRRQNTSLKTEDKDFPSTEETNAKKDLCSNTHVDAITTTPTNKTYVFKGDYYWELDEYGIKEGYPQMTIVDWPGITGDIDAALSWGGNVNKIFLFKGGKYWRYTLNKELDIGYPRSISSGFPGLENDLDAAFVWSGNGKTYFIKGNKYWRYAGDSYEGVDEGYPKQLHIWEGLPPKIDDAMQWKNGKTYFFANGDYYRFDDKSFKVDATFPRNAGLWWFGCINNQYNFQSSRYDGLVQADDHPNSINHDIKKTYPYSPKVYKLIKHSRNRNLASDRRLKLNGGRQNLGMHRFQQNRYSSNVYNPHQLFQNPSNHILNTGGYNRHRNNFIFGTNNYFRYSALKMPRKTSSNNSASGVKFLESRLEQLTRRSNNSTEPIYIAQENLSVPSVTAIPYVLNDNDTFVSFNNIKNMVNLSSMSEFDPDAYSDAFHDMLQAYISNSTFLAPSHASSHDEDDIPVNQIYNDTWSNEPGSPKQLKPSNLRNSGANFKSRTIVTWVFSLILVIYQI